MRVNGRPPRTPDGRHRARRRRRDRFSHREPRPGSDRLGRIGRGRPPSRRGGVRRRHGRAPRDGGPGSAPAAARAAARWLGAVRQELPVRGAIPAPLAGFYDRRAAHARHRDRVERRDLRGRERHPPPAASLRGPRAARGRLARSPVLRRNAGAADRFHVRHVPDARALHRGNRRVSGRGSERLRAGKRRGPQRVASASISATLLPVLRVAPDRGPRVHGVGRPPRSAARRHHRRRFLARPVRRQPRHRWSHSRRERRRPGDRRRHAGRFSLSRGGNEVVDSRPARPSRSAGRRVRVRRRRASEARRLGCRRRARFRRRASTRGRSCFRDSSRAFRRGRSWTRCGRGRPSCRFAKTSPARIARLSG